MKIGIIADVHDNLRHLNTALEKFKEEKIELLIHCDWISPFSMRPYITLGCPIKGVLGNGDPDIQKFLFQLQNLKILEGLDLDLSFRFQDLTLDGVRFAVTHGDDDNLNALLVESQRFDVICIGHTHIPEIKESGKTLVVNPGSMVGYMQETGNQPVTIAIYDTKTKKAEIIDLGI